MWNDEAQAEIRRLELKTLYKRFESGIKAAEPKITRELKFDIIQKLDEAKTAFAN